MHELVLFCTELLVRTFFFVAFCGLLLAAGNSIICPNQVGVSLEVDLSALSAESESAPGEPPQAPWPV